MGALDARPLAESNAEARMPRHEAALWDRWRNGADVDARAALLELHLPYAKQVAATYYGRRFNDEIEFEDYRQLASLGLIEALDRFDPAMGAQFRTFAARRMHGAIVDGLEHATEKQQQIAARQRLEAQRLASIRDAQVAGDGEKRIATPAARTSEQVLQYVAETGLAFALSWLLDGTGMVEAEEKTETLPFYRGVELRELRQRILDLVAALPAQERRVIQGHYLQELPFEEIAVRLGVGRSRVSQVHKRALARLRDALREEGGCDVLA